MTLTRKIVSLLVATVAVVAGAVVFQMRSAAAPEGPSLAAGLFYEQSLRDSGGTVRAMSEYRGKVVVVNFWATWCVPCVQEIPAFSKAHADAGGRVAFVGLGIDSPSNITAFAGKLKPSYPLVAAGAGGTDLIRAFGNPSGALPFTVVLGSDGRVVASHLGRVDDAQLQQWIAPYLKTPAVVGASAGLRPGDPT